MANLARQKQPAEKNNCGFHCTWRDKRPDCYLQKQEDFMIFVVQNETVYIVL